MKKFMGIWIGELISNIGSGMTAFALSVYVYQLTKSVAWVSVIALLAYLPTILLNPVGGILADRYDRRLMMICGDLFSGIGLVYLLVSIWSGNEGLLPVLIGVMVNAVFIALLDPSYKATITDLLTEEEYARASGLVQMAGNAKYLISPALAGILLGIADIRLILLIDIGTIFITVFAVTMVRRNMEKKAVRRDKLHITKELKAGIQVIAGDMGIRTLVILMTFVCFFIAFIQTLMVPMLLPISDAGTVGIMESVSAVGMMAGSIIIGGMGIKKNHAKILMTALVLCGIFMGMAGISTNLLLIFAACTLFFATLPFVNTCADVLIRVRIPDELQGRVWGLISLFTQIGYVAAYVLCGLLADYVFEPLMQENGLLAVSVGRLIGTGRGRGIGAMLILAGGGMVVTVLLLRGTKSISVIGGKNHGYKSQDV